MPFIVPPGGFAGFNQMTPASRAALGRVGGTPYKKNRRRKSVKAASGRRRAKARKRNGSRKLKFGSPAWQKKYKVGRYRK